MGFGKPDLCACLSIMSFPEKVLNNVDAQNYSLAVSLCTLNLPLTLGHLAAAGAKQAGEFGQNGEKI